MSKRFFTVIAVLFGTLIVASCAMGPDYQRPETPVPEAFRQSAESGESIANMDWWELFGDEQLKALIQTALEQNRDLAIALSRIDITSFSGRLKRASL